MGFSHRVSNRLHLQAEKIRRLSASVNPYFRLALVGKNDKKKNPKSLSFIGISLVLLLVSVFYRISSLPHSPSTSIPLYLGGILTSLLGLVWLMETVSSMDIPLLNYGPASDVAWRPLLTRILNATKRNFTKMEEIYMDMKNISILINQLVFFCLCERIFMLRQPVVSFYTLMFFNVIAYCVSYIKEIIEREDWSMYIHIGKGSSVRHLAMSTTKIVLEWTKAITFIITVVFLLLMFGLEKGLKTYSPGTPYLVMTGIYYILSEKVFVDLILKIFDFLKLECFENMENLYSPLILNATQIVLSFIFTIICGLLGHTRLTIVSCFTNIRVKYKDVDSKHWKPLLTELVRLMKYRCANREELLQHDDVCAICLQTMKTARVTPCHHLFHADCLSKCLKQTIRHYCPICKQDLSSMETIVTFQ